MVYCRYAINCDAFIYESATGGIQFHIKGLVRPLDYNVDTRQDALNLIESLRQQNVEIPYFVDDKLKTEIENGIPENDWDNVYL